jgi:hypothetical protein
MLCIAKYKHNSENCRSPYNPLNTIGELSRFATEEQSEECAFSGQIDFSRLGEAKIEKNTIAKPF